MSGEIILYQTEDGATIVQLHARDGSVWLTQAEIAELFQTSIPNINQHIKAILAEREQTEATIKSYLLNSSNRGESHGRAPRQPL